MTPDSVRTNDPGIYGIDWDADEGQVGAYKPPRIREKPFCEIAACENRVSTEFGKPKPYCADHVLMNPYAASVAERWEAMSQADKLIDRKRAEQALKDAEDELL